MRTVLFLLLLSLAPQQVRFDDVVRNLRNPDPKARMDALKLLGESRYFEAVLPIAPLVNDPIDAIQLEAIGTELSFWAVQDIRARKRVALIIETRSGAGRAENVFNAGAMAVLPRPAPAELVDALLKAVDDENPKVRIEAIYALGSIAQETLNAEQTKLLIKALDHYDPAIRAAAARVIGRLRVTAASTDLIKTVNDSQQPVRFAAMRALGDIKERTAITALTEQLEHYRKGEGAWSALDALAKIGDAASVPVFQARLSDRDEYIRRAAVEGLGRAGDASQIPVFEAAVAKDSSEMVRAAMAFALVKLGRDYTPQLLSFLGEDKVVSQVGDYLIELGPTTAEELVKRLGDPDGAVRANAALILGAVGTRDHLVPLQRLAQDRDADVRRAVERAIERINLRFGSA
jgi:HEAT repeat protein